MILPLWFLAAASVLLGAAFGSFANVVIYRLPAGISIVRPGSSCPHCGRAITWYDNLPILSYLVLRGRCRHCRARISPRYLVVEVAAAVLWTGVTLRFGLSWVLPAFFAFVTALLILSAIDLAHRRIPNRVLAPATILAVILLTLAALGEGEPRRLVSAALGALAYGLPMLLLALAVPAGMGMGDVKLAGYLGLHLGWLGLWEVALGALGGFIAGGVVAVGLLALGRKGRKDPLPFGPFMAAGAFAALIWGERIIPLWLGR